MTVERVELTEIAKDLCKAIGWRKKTEVSWRIWLIADISLCAMIFSLSALWWIALVLLVPIAYLLVRILTVCVKYGRLTRLITGERAQENITVSREMFSHMTDERVFYPHFYRHSFGLYINVSAMCFRSGQLFVIPRIKEHYSWSRYAMGERGLDDLTFGENGYYLVTLNADRNIRYAYNARLFSVEI
jgi:hypothetical protein